MVYLDDEKMRGAVLSGDRRYRYSLWRRDWETPYAPIRDMAVFVGLNPSTADELTDDPTIRRCVGFAKSLGLHGVVMLNLFAVRATDPRVMLKDAAPIGPENDAAILELCSHAGKVICAWGNHGSHQSRGDAVRQMLRGRADLCHMGLTKSLQPKHPLYLRADTATQEWTPADLRAQSPT